jgi:hypothetical protein
MVSAAEIGSVVESIGPRDHDIEEVVSLTDGEYVVRYDDLDVTLEFEAETDRLVLSAELGAAPSDKKTAVYTTLLNYSLLWKDTGGVHMALTADDVVVQMASLTGSEVNADRLIALLRNFAEKARLFRNYVQTGGGESIDTLMPLGMRV